MQIGVARPPSNHAIRRASQTLSSVNGAVPPWTPIHTHCCREQIIAAMTAVGAFVEKIALAMRLKC